MSSLRRRSYLATLALVVMCVLFRILTIRAQTMNHLDAVAAGLTPGHWGLLSQDDGVGGPTGPNYSWGNLLYATTTMPSDCTGSIYEFSHNSVFDPTSQKIFYVGAGHGLTCDGRMIAYDLATNHWGIHLNGTSNVMPASGCAGHANYNALDPNRREMYYGILTTAACQYKFSLASTAVLPYTTPGAFGFSDGEAGMDYFPEHNRMFLVQNGAFGEYNSAGDTTQPCGSACWVSGASLIPTSPTSRLTAIGARDPLVRYSKRCQCVIIAGGASGDVAAGNFTIMRGVYQYRSTDTMAGGPHLMSTPVPHEIALYHEWSIGAVDPNTGMLYVFAGRVVAPDGVGTAPCPTCWYNMGTDAALIYQYDPLLDTWISMDATELNMTGSPAQATHWWRAGDCGPWCPESVVATAVDGHGVILLESGYGAALDGLISASKVFLYKPPAMTFAQKCASNGVISCYGFDSASDVRNFPVDAAYPMKYTWTGTPCNSAGLGTFYGPPSYNRLATEAIAYARTPDANNDSVGPCNVPHINTTTHHTGTGALELDLQASPVVVSQGQSYFDTTFLGIDHQPSARFGGPDQDTLNGTDGLWIQYYYRTHNVIAADFNPVFPNGELKMHILCSHPPSGEGNGCGTDATLDNVFLIATGFVKPTPAVNARNGILDFYIHGPLNEIEHPPNSATYLENAPGVLCPYNGAMPQVYNFPPCIRVDDDNWHEITMHEKLQPVDSNFTISGTTLTRAGTFSVANTPSTGSWVQRQVYIVGDAGHGSGESVAGFYSITAKIDDNSVTLDGTPTAGSGKTVYISSYPNLLLDQYVDGVLVNTSRANRTYWDYANPGWGQLRLLIQFGAAAEGSFLGSDIAVYYDDLVISTQPIGFLASSGTPTATRTTNMTLTGIGFIGATAVNISGSGIATNNLVVNSDTTLHVDFIVSAGAATGLRTATVTTPSGTSNTSSFTVNNPVTPMLASIVPSTILTGMVTNVALNGTGFTGATAVTISGAGITASNLMITSDTAMTADFNATSGAATGSRTVTVTNSFGTSNTVPLTVNSPVVTAAHVGHVRWKR